ncbi:FbpB family small basic protein [Bacillus shivajii]|nr:FbpB family small basic protein [Bacillus shivajii]UCZ54056.1 FbpB family small basic protein [Bacillus shivajii]
MRKRLSKSFNELVNENKQQLLRDEKAISQIERKVDDKYVKKELQKA